MNHFRTWFQFLENHEPISVQLQTVIDQSDLQLLDFKSMFGQDSKQTLKHLTDNPKFLDMLEERNLHVGPVTDTRDFASLIKDPISFCMIMSKDATDLEKPTYVLIQRGETIDCFYVTDDILKFFNRLTNRIVKIKAKDSDHEYVYKTTNAGENWSMQDSEKKADLMMKKEFRADELVELIKSDKIKITAVS